MNRIVPNFFNSNSNQYQYVVFIPLYTLSGFYICPPLQCFPTYFYYLFTHFPYFQIHIFFTFLVSSFLDIFPFPLFQISILLIFLIFSISYVPYFTDFQFSKCSQFHIFQSSNSIDIFPFSFSILSYHSFHTFNFSNSHFCSHSFSHTNSYSPILSFHSSRFIPHSTSISKFS